MESNITVLRQWQMTRQIHGVMQDAQDFNDLLVSIAGGAEQYEVSRPSPISRHMQREQPFGDIVPRPDTPPPPGLHSSW